MNNCQLPQNSINQALSSGEPSTPANEDSRCRCAACCTEPSETYTANYMEECLARSYGHCTPDQREEFEDRLGKTSKNWNQRLTEIKSLVAKLKAENRFETVFWKERYCVTEFPGFPNISLGLDQLKTIIDHPTALEQISRS